MAHFVSCLGLFFFQAEDGIRDGRVTGVQTCALPIWLTGGAAGVEDHRGVRLAHQAALEHRRLVLQHLAQRPHALDRSEERRVGKEWRSRWSRYHERQRGRKRAMSGTAKARYCCRLDT